jgi:dimethylhistidine N-methyltransferase
VNTTPTPSLTPQFINAAQSASNASSTQQELTASLLKPAASLSPKFFYDTLGSKLFEAITLLDEYYPTRTEASIFEAHSAEIARAIAGSGIQSACLIDLGAGNCAKAAAFIPHLLPSQYVPVDISVDFLREASSQVQASFPALDIVGVGMDFSSTLNLPDAVQSQHRLFFYPGSSLGNFSPPDALRFLQQIADTQQGNASGLLLGIDLVKDAAVLEAAYDDAVGVTAAFNKNVLLNINAQLGTDFDLRQWKHVGLFNAPESRIEMHLQAAANTTVRWSGHERRFEAGERIHTENSYKYTLDGMTALLNQAGFSQVQHWTDTQAWFAVFWAAK